MEAPARRPAQTQMICSCQALGGDTGRWAAHRLRPVGTSPTARPGGRPLRHRLPERGHLGTSACPLCCLSVGQPWRNRFAAFGLAGTSRLSGHARPQLAKPPRLSAGTRRLYVFLVQRRGNGSLPVPYMQTEQAPAKLERAALRGSSAIWTRATNCGPTAWLRRRSHRGERLGLGWTGRVDRRA
jgi:hypothetical protein